MSLGWQCPVCGSVYAPAVLECSKEHHLGGAAPHLLLPGEQQSAVNEQQSARRFSSKALDTHYEADPQFLEFWKVYPLHLGKAPAFRRWKQQIAAGTEAAAIIAGAARYRSSSLRDELKTKHAEGWLSDRRWEDEYDTAKPESPVAASVKSEAEVDADWERMRREDDERIAALLAEEGTSD